MAIIQAKNAQVGQVIVIGGLNYKVVKNLTAVFGELIVTRYPQGGTEQRASQIHRAWGGTDTPLETARVDLTAELRAQVGTTPNLTEQLKAQVKQKSLTDSLRDQVTNSRVATVKTVDAVTKAIVGSVARKVDAHDGQIQQANRAIADVGRSFGGLYRDVAVSFNEVTRDVAEIQDAVEAVDSELEDLRAEVVQLRSAEEQRQYSAQIERKVNEKLALQKRLDESLAANKSKSTGGNGMNKLLNGFKNQFGKVVGQFAFAANGAIAVRKNPNSPVAEWVTYDQATGAITDVADMVLKFDVPAFKMPVEADKIAVGNIVVNTGKYGYVTEVVDDFVKVVYPQANAQGSVIPTTNLLLQKAFYTVVTTLDKLGNGGGGFNPLLLSALSGEGSKKDILPFLLMSGGLGGAQGAGATGATGAIDPSIFLLLEDKVDDILPLLLLQQGGFTQAGFNPLLFALAGDGDIDPTMLMLAGGFGGAQGQAGGINPLMFALMGDKKGGKGIDLTTLALMGGLGGGAGFLGGNVAQPLPTTVQAPKAAIK